MGATNKKGDQLDFIITEGFKNDTLKKMDGFAGSDHSLIISQVAGLEKLRICKSSLGISKEKVRLMNQIVLKDGNLI